VNRTLATPFFVTCGVLLAILPLEWLPAAAPQAMKPAVTAHPASATNESEPKDTEDLADTVLGRPLFTVGRRPPKSSGGGHVVANTGLPRLAGIMITPAGKWAIFAPDGGGKQLVLSQGGALDDATVRTIQRDRVVVNGPKGEQVLWPTYDHNRSGQTTIQPNFGQPGFNPGGPTPGFGPGFPGRPTFPVQPQMPQPPPQGAQGDNGDDDASGPSPPLPNQPTFPGQPVPAFPRE